MHHSSICVLYQKFIRLEAKLPGGMGGLKRSDHAPLLMICSSEEEIIVKPFHFLNFWRHHKNFKKIVEENRKVDFVGNPFIEFQAKMKKAKKALAGWSKEVLAMFFNKLHY